ncbi:MAG: molybdopterin molybdenumtransferase MoeA, partial [Sulfurimonas sp.]
MSLLSYETSQTMLGLLEVDALRSQNVYLGESLGRVLFEDVVAKYNDPEFPTAAMDGYAILHEDLENGRIEIVGYNPAGSDEKRTLKSGECIKTFTGSMMPHGADTLIPIENVTVEDGAIFINESVPLGYAVRPIGEGY